MTADTLPPLPEPAANYGQGCRIHISHGDPLYTADQLLERDAMWMARIAVLNEMVQIPSDGIAIFLHGMLVQLGLIAKNGEILEEDLKMAAKCLKPMFLPRPKRRISDE